MDAKEYLESKNVEYPLSSMDVLGSLNSIGVIELNGILPHSEVSRRGRGKV
jgi:hypothetical protein